MSRVLHAVFGGGETSSKSNPVDTTPEELKTIRPTLASGLNSVISSGGGPQYGGPLVAPITGTETQALGNLNDVAQNPGRQDYLNSVISGKYLPGQPGANPFLQSAIEAAQRPTQTALNDTLGKTLPGVFTQAGQQIGGGLRSPNASAKPGATAFDTAAARAFEGGAHALGDIATNISFQGYNAERQNQQQAVQLQQQDVQSLINNLQAQALPRLIQEQGITAGLDQFNKRTQALLQALQVAAGSPIATQGQQSSQKGYTDTGVVPALFPKGAGGGSTGTS
jgi:hypothetical protein